MYVDSSALVKLVLSEPESAAAGSLVASAPRAATSVIALLEVAQAVKRADPGADGLSDADGLLHGFDLFEVDEALLRDAARLPGRLRSLDAIHLASALAIGAESMLVYDHRLAEAAASAGLAVLAPT